MSKKEKNSDTKQLSSEEQAVKRGRRQGIVLGGAMLAFFVAGCLSTGLIMNALNKNDSPANSQSTTDSSESSDNKSLNRELLSGSAKDEELEHVTSIFNTIRSNNTAFVVENSSGYDGYMYNKNGECIQQNSDSSVSTLFTGDGHSVRVNTADGTIALDGSIDILTSCENVLNNAANSTDGYSVYRTESSKDNNGVTYSSCVVNIKGFDACKTLYENLGDEMATSAIEKIKEIVDTGYNESTSDGDSYDWTPEFEYVFVYSDNGQFGMQCNCIIDGKAENNWYTDGYQETAEWKLTDAWKDVDWTSNTEDNFDSICELLNTELDAIDKVVNATVNESSTDENTTDATNTSDVDSESESETSESK